MALVLKDRVRESSTTSGTGSITLAGAYTGYQSFATAIASGSTVYYTIRNTTAPNDGEWEVGVGTFTAPSTLSRDTVFSSSTGGSKVSFSTASILEVFVTQPAEQAVYINDATGKVEAFGNGTNTITFTDINTTNLVANTVTLTAGTITTNAANGTDITNKTYVDGLFSTGISYHAPVRVESPTNLNATYNQPGGAGNGVGATLTNAGTQAALVIDGVTLSVNDRVLVYTQTNQVQNGIYTVTNVGSGSTNWVLTRATDANSYGLADPNKLGQGDAVFVQQGNTGAGETYVCNTAGTITFGTTNITFAQISTSQIYSAGTGLNLSNLTFSIANTTVVSGLYGDSANVAVIEVNAQGQLVSAANSAINVSNITVGTLSNDRTTASASNGANTIVLRDSSGSFNANVVTATTVNATTGNFTNISANASGLTAINASNISSGTIANARTTGNTSNSANTIVLRDANGSFAANIISGSFSGDGSAVNAINASNISSGTIANARTTAASSNGASTIVQRDSGGNFSANTVTAAVIGDLSGGSAINASNISSGTIANARTTASSSNGASTIVLRDAGGAFAAGAITATSLSGNGASITAINASAITTGTIDNARTTASSANGASTIVARDSGGNFSANTITATTFSGAFSGNGATISAINASNISSGTTSVSVGGTGINSLTSGYIPFGNGTSPFGSSANLFWDSANARLGVGTSAPAASIHLVNETNSGWRYDQYNNGDGTNFRNYRARGTITSPTAVQANDRLGSFLAAGYNGSTFSGINGGMSIFAAENFSGTNCGTYVVFGTTATGANTGGGGTERMRIDSSGNVGIGTTAPDTKLSVLGNSVRFTQSTYSSGTTGSGILIDYASAYTRISSYTNGFSAWGNLILQEGGNVGIGTTSPIGKLDVVGGRTFLAASNEVYALGVRYNSGTGAYYIGATNSATPDLVFSQVGGSEAMRVFNSRGVSINNTTDPGAGNLSVSGNIFSTASIVVGQNGAYQAGSLYSDSNWGMIFRARQASPTLAEFMWVNSAGAELFRYNGSALTTNITGSASGLTSSNYITSGGGSGNWNTDFQNTTANTTRYGGDMAGGTNSPGGTWWFQQNYRHNNASSFWGVQVAWGWEDNANILRTRNVTGGSYGSWVTYLNSNNYTSYSPSLTGSGASGTWGINISGTAANTNSISSAVGGGYTWTGWQYFRSNENTAAGSGKPLQAYSDNGGGATMSFHRGGAYAVNMGLDSDNVFRIGGWSAAANRLQMDMSGNLTMAGTVTADTPFFLNPTTVAANYTVPANYNAHSAGPITINSGVTVTVSTGSSWVIV